MSKKHKHPGHYPGPQTAGLSHEAEYHIIKIDLIKVLILNAVYLAGILALYFADQKSRFLDAWFARVLHF